MSNWTPTIYKTKNWSDYNNALKQRGSLSIWFDVEMAWEAKPSTALHDKYKLDYKKEKDIWAHKSFKYKFIYNFKTFHKTNL